MFSVIKRIKINRLEHYSTLLFERVKEIIKEIDLRLKEHLNDETYSTEAKKEIKETLELVNEPLRLELQYIKLKQKYGNNIDNLYGIVKNWSDYLLATMEIDTLNSQKRIGEIDDASFMEAGKPFLQTREEVPKRFKTLLEEK